jgi:nucleoporin NUP159
MTEMSDDSRRALLPMTAGLTDTSPIGVALDLSSKEKVVKPIPSDEMDASQTPLPALMVLNNEGVLASWWIVYSDSVRQGTMYPGLVLAEGAQQPSTTPAQGPTSAFGGPPKPAFGAPSIQAPAATGAFGAPSGLGMRQSPWATSSTAASTNAPAFGASAFGTPSAPSMSKPAFGSSSFGATSTPAFGTSTFGAPKQSPWGTAGSTSTTAAFGQASGLGKPAGAFGSAAPAMGAAPPSTGGFASFASKGGFAATAAPSGGSIFGAKPSTGVFGAPSTSSGVGTSSIFGGAAKPLGEKPAGLFGSTPNTNGFVLGSGFKADQSAKDEAPEPSNATKGSFFGGAFGNALGEAAKSPLAATVESKDADMDSTEDVTKPEEPAKPVSAAPVSTGAPATSSFFSPPPATDSGGLFGRTSLTSSTSTIKPTSSTGFSFGKPAADEPKSGAFTLPSLNASPPKQEAPVQPPVENPPSSPKVKEEPLSDGETRALRHRMDEPPLPPDATSKTSYAAGDTSVSSIGTDAPLPPDFIPKAAPKFTLPSTTTVTDAPLPPDFIPKAAPKLPVPAATSEPAVSKPIPAYLIPPSDIPGGPEDEGEDSGFLTEEDEGDESEAPSEEAEEEEGSGEDVTKDLSPVSEANETPGFTPQSSFGGLANRGPKINLFTKIQKPQPGQGRSLFGELDRSAPVLPPPNGLVSPRSPSPVRSALPGRMLRPESSRSVSAPGIASQILGSQRLSRSAAPPAQSTFTLSLEQQRAEEKRRAEARALKEASEKQALVDNEDDEVQKFLASEPIGTTTLDEFVAHTNYIAPPSMDSIPAQVETVYRDINSMIDTLGLNARTLKCFIKGHTEQRKVGGRTREDLDADDDWCLVEIEDLSEDVEPTLMRELEDSRVTDVADKLDTCTELQKDLIKLRARHEDIKKIHAARFDPAHLSTARAQPLSAEQAAQQHDLRRDFHKFQNLLAEAEEGLTVLKAKIVSQATSSGKSGTGAGPTVEAVMRTITKMTSMAEKRSGDIDVLEGQMRKLRFDSAASTGSREGSPFATPQNNQTSLRHPGTSSTYGLFYTPDSTKEHPRSFQDSLMSSTGSFSRNSPPRKKLSGYTQEEKGQLRTKLAKKKMVTDRLRAALQKAGTNVRLMDDDDEKYWG